MTNKNKIEIKHVTITMLMGTIMICAFLGMDYFMSFFFHRGKTFWQPSLPWDNSIPVLPVWVWVYILYYPLCLLPLAWKEFRKNKIIFQRTIAGFLLISLISYLFFGLVSSQMIRPKIQTADISSITLFWLYKLDPGFNIFPSLHVAYVSYIACIAWKLHKKITSVLIWITCLLIGASTLFVKQHYLLDLPAGLVVGVSGYYIAFLFVKLIPKNVIKY